MMIALLGHLLLLSAIADHGDAGISSLITEKHRQELTRLQLIEWERYKPVVSVKKMALGVYERRVANYSDSPCFPGCSPLTPQSIDSSNAATDAHGPATLSLVIPWCCEGLSFFLREVNFRGLLKEVFIYDKCSQMAADRVDCRTPTRASFVAGDDIGDNRPEDVADVKVHIIDLNEPGRANCMSTDECGA
jgi:hypothetical protein